MRAAAAALACLALVAGGCGPGPVVLPSPAPSLPAITLPGTPARTGSTPTATVTATPQPTWAPCPRDAVCPAVAQAISKIDPARLNDHLLALTSFGSRDPRHPGHGSAVAYIKEQLEALSYYGWKVSSQRTVHNGIPLENVFASLEGATAASSGSILQRPAPATSWVIVAAHYDSIAVRTPGWRPAVDPAPGADDNATGTAALLEFARVISTSVREALRQRVVLAFFDGEELYWKGSAAYVQALPRPYPVSAVVNIDMVGFNPITDRLDLFWYGAGSAALRDRVKAANERYAIGVSPLREVFADDPQRIILDSAPFGVAGIPAITLTEGYADADATWPGNSFFHTVNDTPDKVTNRTLWLKAAKLTLAAALELALSAP